MEITEVGSGPPINHYKVSQEAITRARKMLSEGVTGLHFEQELEERFEHYHTDRYFSINRIYPLLGALLLVLSLFADHIVIPEIIKQAFYIRLIGAMMILTVVFAGALSSIKKYFQVLLCLGIVVIHGSLIWIGCLATEIGQFHYQSGALLTIIFTCMVLRIQFHYVFPYTIIMWLMQVLAMQFLMKVSAAQFTELLFLHTFVTIIGLLVNYRVEFETRKNFLQQLILYDDQKDLLRTHQELKRLTTIDSLTQLANRRCFDKTLISEWQRAMRNKDCVALLMIDIDDIKTYNDHYGVAKGDECLCAVAACISRATRRSSDLVARYGGEEIAVLLPQTDLTDAGKRAQQIVEDVFNLNLLNVAIENPGRITVSVGVHAIRPHQDEGITDFVKQVNQALYTAKENGKNQSAQYQSDATQQLGL